MPILFSIFIINLLLFFNNMGFFSLIITEVQISYEMKWIRNWQLENLQRKSVFVNLKPSSVRIINFRLTFYIKYHSTVRLHKILWHSQLPCNGFLEQFPKLLYLIEERKIQFLIDLEIDWKTKAHIRLGVKS